MPIVGLTDNVAPRFPRLGKLRKGDPRPENGKAPGKDSSHFRFDSDSQECAAAFASAYGSAPVTLQVFLPYRAPDENFATWKEAWSAGGLVHRCDGQTCTIWRTPDGKYSRTPKPCPGGCKEVGRLELILPELIRRGHVGYVTLETHSNHDLRNVMAALNAAYASGDLRGIEWTLTRVKTEISTPGEGGQRARREKWLVYLTPSVKWAQVQLALSQSQALQLAGPTGPAETVNTETGEVLDAPRPEPVDDPDDEDFDAPKAPKAPQTNADKAGLPPARVDLGLLDKLWKRYEELEREAHTLGIETPTVSVDATAAELTAAGKSLAAQVKAAQQGA